MSEPVRKSTQPVAVPRDPMYVTWTDDRSKAAAMYEVGEALRKVEPVVRAAGSDIFVNIAPGNVSVRDGMTRQDYDTFRREQAIPDTPKGLIWASMQAYKRVGIIRNIIDLMADFGSQGVDVTHPNERIERWYKEWFRRVGGKDRSERFLNLLYRTANVIVRRQTATLPDAVEEEMRRAQGAPDLTAGPAPAVAAREVPWKYTLLSPLAVEVEEEELALFAGGDAFRYAVKVPRGLRGKLRAPRTAAQRELVARLPAEVRKAIAAGSDVIPLDPDRVRGFYYKRDDWEVWAGPMVESILPDLQVLQKMKLADLAALDGAISCIRVWKLGDVKERIFPGAAAINRLAQMLVNNVGGGVMDLVWDATLQLTETSTDVYRFLGETKYGPCLTAIYAGLGIPPTLTGAPTSSGGGFTNNFISLKTLTERLQYGRDVLRSFWEEEIRLVQRALGFRFPATLVFDRMVLSDEAAEKQLLLNMADRGLISDETLQDRFGECPEIERVRIRREWRQREAGRAPPKAGPFSPDKEHDFKKSFVQQGVLSPSEVGLDLPGRKGGEKTPLEAQGDQTAKQARVQLQSQDSQNDHQFRMEKLQLHHGVHPAQLRPGQPGQGRPKLARDAGPRKQKRVTPRTSAAFIRTLGWAENAQARVGQVAAPAYLRALGKKTLRELTDEEARRFEAYKFYALCQLRPDQEVDAATVAALSAAPLAVPAHVDGLLRETVAEHARKTGKQPSFDHLRRYQAGAYAFWKGDYGDVADGDAEGEGAA